MSDGYLKLRWTGHTSTVVSLLERFRVQGLFCDATISCDRKIYPVHQVVLSACSDFFASLFAATRHQSPIVVLQDVAPAHLESLLLYMYCGETHVRQCDLHLFMKVAESLQIKGLIGANSSEHPDPSTKNLVSDAKESDGVHKKNSSSPLLLSTQTLHGSVRGSSAGEGCQAVHFKEDINQEHHNLRKFPQQEYVSKICSSAGGNDEKSNKERINLGRPEGPDGKNWEDIEDQAREKSSSNVTNVSVSRPCKSENEEIKFKEEVQDGFVHETDPGSCGVWDAVETREDDDDDDDDVYQDLVIAEDDDDIWDAQNNNQVEGLSCHQEEIDRDDGQRTEIPGRFLSSDQEVSQLRQELLRPLQSKVSSAHSSWHRIQAQTNERFLETDECQLPALRETHQNLVREQCLRFPLRDPPLIREPPPLMKISSRMPNQGSECERRSPPPMIMKGYPGKGSHNTHLLVEAPPTYQSVPKPYTGLPGFSHNFRPVAMSSPSSLRVIPVNEAPLNLSGPSQSPDVSEEPNRAAFLERITGRRRRSRGPKSWEFLVRLISDPSTNPSLIRWENEASGTFRLVRPSIIAQQWGRRASKHASDCLSYENFARGLRYHYATGALHPVSEKNLVYRFGMKALELLKKYKLSAFTHRDMRS